jgi:hypothetical protein
MNETLTVADITTKQTATGGLLVSVTDTEGRKVAGFDKKLATLKPGDIIEAEIALRGNFTNIVSWHMVTPATGTLPGSYDVPGKPLVSDMQLRIILVALLYATGKIQDDDPLVERLHLWLKWK